RDRPNSRVKDLPDLALLGRTRPIDSKALREAIEATFTFRGTQPVPVAFPDPPAEWAPVYERMARQDGLEWRTVDEVVSAVRTFLGPVLSGEDVSRWIPGEWRWERSGRGTR
ncbi:MAG TPA: nucleotidyl transferase AbiEii/AbiGii toxin family protein, partial [Spirochaetia bacterium]|nr:nucleotidyl transferase AbiEii/AbiGii toxin family protein [Spirochaetia bacterium]